MKTRILAAVIAALGSTQFAYATHAQFIAKPERSEWMMVANSPLECRLVHPIPGFGQAEFSSHASKKINLDFELKMHRPMGSTENVSLISMPPQWQPGVRAMTMEQLKFYQQFDGYVGGQTAWSMMSELGVGRVPTFTFRDWHAQSQSIQVGLSPVRFKLPYEAFSMCVSNLLPYTFEDIAFTILHYNRNSDSLNKASERRLSQIAEYIRYNKDVDLVLVATYSDSSGEKDENQNLTERRAQVLQNYFKSIGLDENRIEVQGYGERRPIADNASPIGKDKNRRVVISLGRSNV
jgi:outer membrane protein OmpA-like peptidoglycan-associated protein